MTRLVRTMAPAVCLSALLVSAPGLAPAQAQVRVDVPYVATPPKTVDAILQLAQPTPGDFLVDLGSGDGRILITAAKDYGSTGLGIDIDPDRTKESGLNAERAGVTDKVKFVTADIFRSDFRQASIVTMYLLASINVRLAPRLLELQPGTRVVSHAYPMGDWKPDKTVTVPDTGATLYYWMVPAQLAGEWRLVRAAAGTAKDSAANVLVLKQSFQRFEGTGTWNGRRARTANGRIAGRTVNFDLALTGAAPLQFEGTITDGHLHGNLRGPGNTMQPVVWKRISTTAAATHQNSEKQ
jgi:hypothetical protein